MPRLRNRVTGVVVNVDDETAARLGADFEAADSKPEPERAPSKRASAKK